MTEDCTSLVTFIQAQIWHDGIIKNTETQDASKQVQEWIETNKIQLIRPKTITELSHWVKLLASRFYIFQEQSYKSLTELSPEEAMMNCIRGIQSLSIKDLQNHFPILFAIEDWNLDFVNKIYAEVLQEELTK